MLPPKKGKATPNPYEPGHQFDVIEPLNPACPPVHDVSRKNDRREAQKTLVPIGWRSATAHLRFSPLIKLEFAQNHWSLPGQHPASSLSSSTPPHA